MPVDVEYNYLGNAMCALHSLDSYGRGPPLVEKVLYIILRESKMLALDPLNSLRGALQVHAPFLSDARRLTVGSACLASVPLKAKRRFFSILIALPERVGTCISAFHVATCNKEPSVALTKCSAVALNTASTELSASSVLTRCTCTCALYCTGYTKPQGLAFTSTFETPLFDF